MTEAGEDEAFEGEAGEGEAVDGEVPVAEVDDPACEEKGPGVEPVDDDIGEEVVTGRLRLLASRKGMSGPFWPQPASAATRHTAQAKLAIRVELVTPGMRGLREMPVIPEVRFAGRKAILPAQPASTAKLND